MNPGLFVIGADGKTKKSFRALLASMRQILEKRNLVPRSFIMNKQDWDDIVKWSEED